MGQVEREGVADRAELQAPPVWAGLGWVVLGGALGTLARATIAALADAGGPGANALADGVWPVSTLAVNLVGALLLGVLLEYLGTLPRGARASAGVERARLLFGVGMLGGFTTYSLLAVQLAEQLLAGSLGAALGYGLVTLCGGVLASWVGVAVARGVRTLVRRGSGREAV